MDAQTTDIQRLAALAESLKNLVTITGTGAARRDTGDAIDLIAARIVAREKARAPLSEANP